MESRWRCGLGWTKIYIFPIPSRDCTCKSEISPHSDLHLLPDMNRYGENTALATSFTGGVKGAIPQRSWHPPNQNDLKIGQGASAQPLDGWLGQQLMGRAVKNSYSQMGHGSHRNAVSVFTFRCRKNGQYANSSFTLVTLRNLPRYVYVCKTKLNI